MVEKADVVVVGAGIVGVCAAWSLAGRGRRVLVLDAGEIGAGCSYGNAGLVCPSHSVPLAAPGVFWKGLKWMLDPESPFYIKPRLDRALFGWLLRFRAACAEKRMKRAIPVLRDLHRASVELFEAMVRGEAIECGWTRRGVLLLFRTGSGYEEGLEEATLLAEHGLPYRAMSPYEVRSLAPQVRAGVAGGIHLLEDAHLDPSLFVRGAASAARKRGAEFRTGTEVLGFETTGRRIDVVRTTRGDFRAGEVVLASGSWAPGIARTLGLRLPIQPAKGYSITVRTPASCPPVPLLLAESKVAVTPMGPHLRFAGTLELAGLDFSINERRVAAIRRAASLYMEGTEDLELVEIWRGLRPCTPDGLPILGRPPAVENLVIAAGHAMIGVSLGPVTGEIAARLVCGEASPVDLTLLRPERFT